MRMPPNYGPQYTGEFERAFTELAKQHGTALVPFLFEDLGMRRDYFQPDGIHPTEAAQPVMLETIWKRLRPLLK
jgi:acyl-CoA thioesterase-1